MPLYVEEVGGYGVGLEVEPWVGEWEAWLVQFSPH